MRHRRNVGVEVEKSKRQSKRNRDRSIDHKLAPANPQIGQPKAKIEADTLQPAEREKAVDPRIQQQHLVEHSKMRRPRRLKPAQIHRKAKNSKDKKIAPVSTLCRICNARAIKQQSDHHRQQQVERKPAPPKLPIRDGNHPIRNAQTPPATRCERR